jgi:hypothetical protein
MIQTVALIALLATPVAAADFEFCWEGANGYRMEGTMRIDDALLNRSILTEDDIGTFFIQGFKDDIALGAWDMSQMTPTTSWNLRFDPRGMVFPTGGMHDSDKGQAWNAGGRAEPIIRTFATRLSGAVRRMRTSLCKDNEAARYATPS